MCGIFLKTQNHYSGAVKKIESFILKIQLRRQKKRKCTNQMGEMEISKQQKIAAKELKHCWGNLRGSVCVKGGTVSVRTCSTHHLIEPVLCGLHTG